MPRTVFFAKVRHIAERWRKSVVAGAGLLFCVAGARIGVPGVDGQIVRDYFRGGAEGLLGLYDLLVGGAISRAAVLALGIMPYLSARCFIWAARSAIPAFGEMTAGELGQRRLTRWTRLLTVGLALVQSYGFARVVQSIPGAVADPGAGFIGQTMLILTGGAIVVTLLAEQFTTPRGDDVPLEGDDKNDILETNDGRDERHVPVLGRAAPDALLLRPGEFPGVIMNQRPRSEVELGGQRRE